jgi:hypothetical protein
MRPSDLSPRHYYSLHGLGIASDLALPELAPAAIGAAIDVEVFAGEVAPALDHPSGTGPMWQAARGDFLFEVADVARYRVRDARTITVQAFDSASRQPGDVRLYLLGTAMGALLHQRGLLALHASAVATPSGTWAFTGHSGAGKSTLAAWLQRREGWPVLSDDVVVVDASGPLPRLQAGPPRLKLWRDALESLAIGPDGLARDLMRFDKFHLVTPPTDVAATPCCRALVLLEATAGDEPAELLPMRGREALAAVMSAVYRPELATHLRAPGELFMQCAQLASRIRVFRFRRPRSLQDFDTALGPLLEGMHAEVG